MELNVETAADINICLNAEDQIYSENNTDQQLVGNIDTYLGLRCIKVDSICSTAGYDGADLHIQLQAVKGEQKVTLWNGGNVDVEINCHWRKIGEGIETKTC